MKLLFEGAEAKVFKTVFFGEKAVLKKRLSKNYRTKELDEKIVSERTKQECFLLAKAKSLQVRTPCIFFADKKKGTIITEFMKGKKLSQIKGKKFDKLVMAAGKETAKLHGGGIIHGDLTTGNLLAQKNQVIFLDFGLGFFSSKTEDKAVDLLVMKKTLKAIHSQNKHAWKNFFKGYKKGSKNPAKSIAVQLKEIEKRTRYS